MIDDFLKGNQPDAYKRYLKDIWMMSDDQIENKLILYNGFFHLM
jgi:hypothetical protein